MINKQQNSMQRRAIAMLIDQAMSKISKNREDALLKIVDLAEKYWNNDYPQEMFEKVGNVFISYID